ncbi:replication initiation protein [Zooshikella ganghwensis]|uniref:replication initiation protein n=1 Tax=Zooshikella ganghwensis TaxID=202772 RepID=UPI00041DC571|nr:replication initiation protein [Zooshikella ganghwensis]
MKELRITKSNKLIESSLLEAAVKFTLRDHKVILAVISQISPKDAQLKPYTLSISELEQLTNIRSRHLYQDISEISDRLTAIKIKIKEPDEPKGFLEAVWFSAIRYRPSKGRVEFFISEPLKPYLIQVKSAFTTYYLRQVTNLQSIHSIRLYPLLRQYLTIKDVENGKTVGFRIISIEELKEVLGISEEQYKKFADFKRYVLQKCQNELEEKTDLIFDFEPIKQGRKIAKLKLIIQANIKPVEVVEDGSVIDGEVLPDGYDEGVAAMIAGAIPELPEKVVTLLASKLDGIAASQAYLSYTKAKKAGKVKDPAAYFLGILKHQEQQAKNSHNPDMDDMSWANRADFDEF